MGRFFFHVQYGALYIDQHGTQVSDQQGARDVALEIVAQLVRGAADDLWRGDALRVIAEDERRQPAFTVEVAIERPSSVPARRNWDFDESRGAPL